MTLISKELSTAREALTLLRIRPDRTLECINLIVDNLWRADLDFDALDLDGKIPADSMRTHIDVLARNNLTRLRRNGELSRAQQESMLGQLNGMALCRLPPLSPLPRRDWAAQQQATITPRGKNRAAFTRDAALRRLIGKMTGPRAGTDPVI